MTVTADHQVQFVKIAEDLRGRKAPKSDAIVANACRDYPGEYAVLPLEGRKPSSVALVINNKGSVAFPKGQFRATKRGESVYVKYVG